MVRITYTNIEFESLQLNASPYNWFWGREHLWIHTGDKYFYNEAYDPFFLNS